MDETLHNLEELLGKERLRKIADVRLDKTEPTLQNLQEIYCECKTLLLRPSSAKLVLPDVTMKKMEKDVSFLLKNDESFKNLTKGCYWLVDDMYKFEQMGFTKEIPRKEEKLEGNQMLDSDQISFASNKSQEQSTSSNHGLRYLACAECNICPLGWFDPKSKESYLYVW